MKLLHACNNKLNKWYVVDTVSQEKFRLTKKELIELYKSEGVYNIKVYGDQVKGNNYSLYRFNDLVSNGRSYVFMKIIKNNSVAGYLVVSATGDIKTYSVDDLYYLSKFTGLVNVDVDELKKGNLVLLDNTYKIKDLTNKTLQYTYDVEDYMKLYNRYKRYGFSTDKPKVGEYSPVFDTGFNLESLQVESNYESFTKNHKFVVALINSAKILEVNPVYEHIEIEYTDNKYRYNLKNLIGYAINFEVSHKGQVYTRQIIVDKADKKLLTVLSKVNKFSGNGFKDLVTYKNHIISGNDGTVTSDEAENTEEFIGRYKDMLNKVKCGQVVQLSLTSGKYIDKDNDIVLKIRNNLKINAIENRYLLNIISK